MSRGAGREREVARGLRAGRWFDGRRFAAWTTKNDGRDRMRNGRRVPSHGVTDVVAVEIGGSLLLLVQVKSSPPNRPYENFRRSERAELVAEAESIGAQAWLCNWPPYAREPTWITRAAWPSNGLSVRTRP